MNYNENLIEFCPYCGCEFFRQKTIDRVDYTICEYAIICNECNEYINSWGYGWFSNHHYMTPEYQTMLRKKKLEKLNEIQG